MHKVRTIITGVRPGIVLVVIFGLLFQSRMAAAKVAPLWLEEIKMADLIVSLQQLPATPTLPSGYQLQPAQAWDREVIVDWVRAEFGTGWASEVANGLSGQPCRVLIARRGSQLLGFACFDVTFPSFFGPTGVSEAARGLGLGKALLIEALHRLRQRGYVYGFIGDAGPVEFYRKTVAAVAVPDGLAGGYTEPLQP